MERGLMFHSWTLLVITRKQRNNNNSDNYLCYF